MLTSGVSGGNEEFITWKSDFTTKITTRTTWNVPSALSLSLSFPPCNYYYFCFANCIVMKSYKSNPSILLGISWQLRLSWMRWEWSWAKRKGCGTFYSLSFLHFLAYFQFFYFYFYYIYMLAFFAVFYLLLSFFFIFTPFLLHFNFSQFACFR